VDARGVGITLHRPADRIISLVPALTSILVDLGAADQLVGRTDYDSNPAVAALPSVGGGIGPSREVLLALNPDLVIGFAGADDAANADWLDASDIPFAAFRTDRMEDVAAVTRALGRLAGVPTRADSLAAGLEGELDALADEYGTRQPSVRTLVLIGGTPPWVAGPGTYLSEMVALVGGSSAVPALPAPYAPISPEILVSADIDLVLVLPGATSPVELLPEGTPVVALPEGVDIPDLGLAEHARWVGETLERVRTGSPMAGSGGS
jgi:ABC-type Fe3+-hydroxamate transport system substrate-binding protein